MGSKLLERRVDEIANIISENFDSYENINSPNMANAELTEKVRFIIIILDLLLNMHF